MKTCWIAIAVAMTGLVAAPGPAWAAAARRPAAPAAPPPAHVVKLLNADTMAVTAVYASPAGKNAWGDDLLGRQTADAGKTVTLGFKEMPADQCSQDLQMLMNDGKTVTKTAIDVCTTADYRFTR
jgi:hypothetical protein